MYRIRIHYSKTQPLRYTSNLDIHKIWERTIRRAQLPIAYSQGFHPQPRINQACPLPLGFLSHAEFIDVWLEETIDNQLIKSKLLDVLPPGIENIQIETIELYSPSPQTLVISAAYEVLLLEEHSMTEIRQSIENLLEQTAFLRTRRGKTYDLRPLINQLSVSNPDNSEDYILTMSLTAGQGATGRPDEVLSALGIDPFACRITRTFLELSPATSRK